MHFPSGQTLGLPESASDGVMAVDSLSYYWLVGAAAEAAVEVAAGHQDVEALHSLDSLLLLLLQAYCRLSLACPRLCRTRPDKPWSWARYSCRDPALYPLGFVLRRW